VTPTEADSPKPYAETASMLGGNPDERATTSESIPPTLNSTTTTSAEMAIDVEAQLLKDWQPFTRPTRWSGGLSSFEPGITIVFKLFPGSASNGEHITASIHHLGMVAERWAIIQALISVDGILAPTARPGQLYIDSDEWHTGGWSCIIHFPVMSHTPPTSGVYSLLLRTVVGKKVTR